MFARGVLAATLLLLRAPAVAEDEGRAAFEEQGCGTCHGVAAAGLLAKVKKGPMAGPDLSGGPTLVDGWLDAYLRRERELEGKPHPKPYEGTEAELAALDAWLRSLEAR